MSSSINEETRPRGDGFRGRVYSGVTTGVILELIDQLLHWLSPL